MVRINYDEFGRMWNAKNDPQAGPKRTAQLFEDCLKDKTFRPQHFSLREAARRLIFDKFGDRCGDDFVGACGGRQPARLLETGADLVSTAAFSNITGQIVFSRILEEFQLPVFVWPSLVETIPTEFDGEKIPDISGIGDEASTIPEGEDYPFAGVAQNFIETPTTLKKGFIVPVTKEAIFFDRTAVLLQRCAKVGEWLGVNKEKAVLSLVTGGTNSFSRNGVAYNTYATTGGHGIVNQLGNVLYDYTDIQAVYDLFDDMTDWTTGEPIVVVPTQLLVPFLLTPVAWKILNATELRHGTSNTTTPQTLSPNVMQAFPGNGQLEVISNRFVRNATSSDVKWFMGDFKRAFKWMQNWDIQTEQRGSESEASFHRDVVQQYKGSYRGIAAVHDPHYVVYSSGGA